MTTLALKQSVYPDLIISSAIEALLRPRVNPSTYSPIVTELQIPETVPQARSIAKRRLDARIKSFQTLPQDWDGYGGAPASPRACEDAITFIERLPLNAKIPRAMLAGNGEISFCWEEGKKYLEASFSGDGTFHFFFDAPEPIDAGDNIVISSGLPDCLKTMILNNFV